MGKTKTTYKIILLNTSYAKMCVLNKTVFNSLDKLFQFAYEMDLEENVDYIVDSLLAPL